MSNINQKPRDKNGKRHGKWLLYYVNGQICFRGNYIHGVPHGLFEYYYENITLYYRGVRNMGKKIGYWYYEYQPNEYHLWLI